MIFWFDWSEFMTFAIGNMKRTREVGQEQSLEPVSMVVEDEDDESIAQLYLFQVQLGSLWFKGQISRVSNMKVKQFLWFAGY